MVEYKIFVLFLCDEANPTWDYKPQFKVKLKKVQQATSNTYLKTKVFQRYDFRPIYQIAYDRCQINEKGTGRCTFCKQIQSVCVLVAMPSVRWSSVVNVTHLQHLRTNYQLVFTVTQGPVAPAHRVWPFQGPKLLLCVYKVLVGQSGPLCRPFKSHQSDAFT